MAKNYCVLKSVWAMKQMLGTQQDFNSNRMIIMYANVCKKFQ